MKYSIEKVRNSIWASEYDQVRNWAILVLPDPYLMKEALAGNP
jgi:hypothetical protein